MAELAIAVGMLALLVSSIDRRDPVGSGSVAVLLTDGHRP